METWWPLRLPQRVLLAAQMALLPLRTLALALEILVLAGFLGGAALLVATYTHQIPEDTIRTALNEAGARALSVLRSQGIYRCSRRWRTIAGPVPPAVANRIHKRVTAGPSCPDRRITVRRDSSRNVGKDREIARRPAGKSNRRCRRNSAHEKKGSDIVTGALSQMLSPWSGFAIAFSALMACIATQEAARRLPAAMDWQEAPVRKVHPRSWGSVAFGTVLATIAAIAHATDSRVAVLAAVATVQAWYLAETDRRDRWIPDHGSILLLVTGLLASPFADPLSRIYGLCGNIGIYVGWKALGSLTLDRRLHWDSFSGGDLVMGAAIGGWLGWGAGQIALALGAWIACVSMAILGSRTLANGGKRNFAQRALDYDPETWTAPVGPYLAIGMWGAICIWPWPLASIT